MILTTNAVAEYEEQVATFFRRASSKAEGEAALNAHANLLMDALPDLLPTIRECPAYAGIAFYGRLKAANLPLLKRLAADTSMTSEKAIAAIRESKALKVSASAKKGWDFLLGADLDALWSAIRLNLCRPAPLKAEKAEESEDEDGDHNSDDHDTQEDEDDDN